MKDVNHDTIIDTLWWYKIWLLSGYNPTSAKKLLRKPRRAYRSSWSRQGNQESFSLTIFQKFATPVKNYPGIIVRQHHTDQNRMGLLREQCVEFRKGHLRYCCNPAWMKNGGLTPWNISVIFESRDLSDYWTGFTQSTLLEEKSPNGKVVRGETDKQAANIQARLFMARNLDEIG